MSKRHLVPHLIGACKHYHRIVLIGLLIFIVGSQNVSPPTTDSTRCLMLSLNRAASSATVLTGSFKETLLIEHNALIQNGTVVPGKP